MSSTNGPAPSGPLAQRQSYDLKGEANQATSDRPFENLLLQFRRFKNGPRILWQQRSRSASEHRFNRLWPTFSASWERVSSVKQAPADAIEGN
jgi:hypothetical protein